ncbi:MAG: hypothetical protein RBS43_06815 [Candidatus Cloacimonas sp.]|jgi:hypothetical protein|nr:hypothetical protein [Candidatus Cloacimonas sp.]
MKATSEAHLRGIQEQDQGDKLGTIKNVTVVQVEGKTPEMLNGRGFEHCDRLTTENYVTMPGYRYPESSSVDTLVTCADASLFAVIEDTGAT